MRSTARPYADALYAVAMQEGSAEPTLSGLEQVGRILREIPEVNLLLLQPEVDHAAAEGVLQTISDGCSPLVGRFVRLLFARRRMAILPEVTLAYRDQLDRDQGVVRGRLESARPVPPEVQRQVAEALGHRTGKRVILNAAEEPGLIGGLRVILEDRVLDVTVAGRLRGLRRQLRAALV